jgi:hypothetical protein
MPVVMVTSGVHAATPARAAQGFPGARSWVILVGTLLGVIMKLLIIGSSVAVAAFAVAAPVMAAGDDKPRTQQVSPSAKPDERASEQGQESSARGRAHRDAMKAWHACVQEQGKSQCEKPAPPGRALGHGKDKGKPSGDGPGPASEDGKGHGYGRAHAPGQADR